METRAQFSGNAPVSETPDPIPCPFPSRRPPLESAPLSSCSWPIGRDCNLGLCFLERSLSPPAFEMTGCTLQQQTPWREDPESLTPRKGAPTQGSVVLLWPHLGCGCPLKLGNWQQPGPETSRRWRSAVLTDLPPPPPKKESLCKNTLSGFDVRLPRDITSNERGERQAE